ncbi:MAE_28990/MAE_18760 family HEPN-like nuclease [Leptospira kanakyensis]|uniref:MAE_28990/MAE_18760 family HEPN-like nuclease n=1 Tax=Leptospira kanakyensis TaxID=2484968 RepID=UPI00223D6660|nr:MAE_28990/MAE_18760 family HEPN-like nuclease [Leptospira kanakyensis]MCW7483206.1 HEPN domain-containing protein [Leptospira kanakyensis]
MIAQKFIEVEHTISGFTGTNGEPADDKEFYILKSMWVMMMSEFEGSVKDEVEIYIDKIKLKPINQIHICLLLKNFYGDSAEPLSIDNILGVYKRQTNEITYKNFTKDRKPKNKSHSIENLFNSLGLFFTEDEKILLKIIDGISSTRDAIAHGDRSISITKSELESSIGKLKEAFQMLTNKLI